MGNFTDKLRDRVLTKGPEVGICVICGAYGKLSRDHIPPRKCNNISNYELRRLLPKVDSPDKGIVSQGGTHFRTLCEKCNSARLGLKYDPVLVELSNEITSRVVVADNHSLAIPSAIFSFVKPQRLARSIVGHLLAAVAVDETRANLCSAPMPDALREYFLDETLPLPEELDIYYWVYPSRQQVVIKGAGKLSTRGGKPIIGDIIKFLPLGFWLVWEKPKDCSINLGTLVPDKRMRIDDIHQMVIDLENIMPLGFPETPESHEVIIFTHERTSVGNPTKKI